MVKYPHYIAVLDKGFVRLVGYGVDLVDVENQNSTLDAQVVRAARVSYGLGTKTKREDENLIRYLMRNEHLSPFEMVELKFHVKAPVFVARQWFRHRTGSVNEVSARYSVMPEEFYVPRCWRGQDSKNRQGSQGVLPDSEELTEAYIQTLTSVYALYEQMLKKGVAREMARMVLPVSQYTEFFWKQDLRNLLHFLDLRLDNHAQEEIRAYAEAILQIIEPLAPAVMRAWRETRQ